MKSPKIDPTSQEYQSAKWYEWASNLWQSKKQELIKKKSLNTSNWNIIKNLKIVIKVNPKFKKLKTNWMKRVEKKLAEMQIKTQNMPEEEKLNLIAIFQSQLERELDELINNWLTQR